jgi:hypothetical protein
MGHLRLDTLPDTAPWRRVVGLLAEGADAAAVAQATTQAALRGLALAHGDQGLVYSFWLLAQAVQAARRSDFATALCDAGLHVRADPDLFELIAGFSDAVDHRLHKTRGRTDLGEMAQLAAVESLTELLGRRSASLFGTTSVEVKQAARELSTEGGFAHLAHAFFARFAQRFLTYHLGRELSNHVGANGRFAAPEEHDEFVEHLAVHCQQAALIVKGFAGDWYSKHRFHDDLTLPKARGFVSHALTKLGDELKIRGERDG